MGVLAVFLGFWATAPIKTPKGTLSFRDWQYGRPIGGGAVASAFTLFLGHISTSHPTWPGWLVALNVFLGVGGLIMFLLFRRPDDPRIDAQSAHIASLESELERMHDRVAEAENNAKELRDAILERAKADAARDAAAGFAPPTGGGSPTQVAPFSGSEQTTEGANL